MIAEILKSYFDPMIQLDVSVWDNFSKLGHSEAVSAGTVLKQNNTTEKYMTFLISGCGGNLIWNKNNFVCTEIGTQGEPLMDYVSFSLQKPTTTEVVAFSPAEIFRISHHEFQKAFEKGGFGLEVTIKALEVAYAEKEQQQIDLLTKDAKERYLQLCASKLFVNDIPLKYLASYLGITPQSLSRIRSASI